MKKISLYLNADLWRYTDGSIEYCLRSDDSQPEQQEVSDLIRNTLVSIEEETHSSPLVSLLQQMEDGTLISTWSDRDFTDYHTFLTTRVNLHRTLSFKVFKKNEVHFFWKFVYSMQWLHAKITGGFNPSAKAGSAAAPPTAPTSGDKLEKPSESLGEHIPTGTNVIPLPTRRK